MANAETPESIISSTVWDLRFGNDHHVVALSIIDDLKSHGYEIVRAKDVVDHLDYFNLKIVKNRD